MASNEKVTSLSAKKSDMAIGAKSVRFHRTYTIGGREGVGWIAGDYVKEIDWESEPRGVLLRAINGEIHLIPWENIAGLCLAGASA